MLIVIHNQKVISFTRLLCLMISFYLDTVPLWMQKKKSEKALAYIWLSNPEREREREKERERGEGGRETGNWKKIS